MSRTNSRSRSAFRGRFQTGIATQWESRAVGGAQTNQTRRSESAATAPVTGNENLHTSAECSGLRRRMLIRGSARFGRKRGRVLVLYQKSAGHAIWARSHKLAAFKNSIFIRSLICIKVAISKDPVLENVDFCPFGHCFYISKIFTWNEIVLQYTI